MRTWRQRRQQRLASTRLARTARSAHVHRRRRGGYESTGRRHRPLGQVCVRANNGGMFSQYTIGAAARPPMSAAAVAAGLISVPPRRPPRAKMSRREQSRQRVSQYAIARRLARVHRRGPPFAAWTGPNRSRPILGGYVTRPTSPAQRLQYAIGTDGSLTPSRASRRDRAAIRFRSDASGHHVYWRTAQQHVSIYAIGANGSLTASTPSFVPSQNARQSSR